MNPNYFKSFGVLTILFDLALFFIVINEPPGALSPVLSIRMLVLFTAVGIVGFGLLCLRKWAAIYFSFALFSFGLWLFMTSIAPIPFPLNLLCMCVGLSLMLPLVVTVRIWPKLTWGGKWFF